MHEFKFSGLMLLFSPWQGRSKVISVILFAVNSFESASKTELSLSSENPCTPMIISLGWLSGEYIFASKLSTFICFFMILL